MKIICQTFGYLSLLWMSLSGLEAKTLEVLLDHQTDETFILPSTETYAKQVKIENKGDRPVKNCFPFTNHAPCLTLETLAAQIAAEEQPLLALYELWNRSLIQDERAPSCDCHPLDLLNFQGACTQEAYTQQFIRLCNALGIQTRLANIHGKERYDFCLDEEWNFLDIGTKQLYLSLSNDRLVSSEEVMDDPFLALRTKHHRKAPCVDFREGWKEVAQFEILEPASAVPVAVETPELTGRRKWS